MIPLRRRDGASVVAVYHFVTNNAGRTEDLGAMDLVDMRRPSLSGMT
jgi:hypothetical protein